MSSSKEINTLIPLFNGAEYRTWRERMTNFLGYVTGAHPRPVAADANAVTVAEQAAMDDWDGYNLQVKSLIGLRLSPDLHTHMGTTAQATWDSLENTFVVSYFTMDFCLLQEVMRAKLRVDRNPQVEIQHIWTLLERIHVTTYEQ